MHRDKNTSKDENFSYVFFKQCSATPTITQNMKDCWRSESAFIVSSDLYFLLVLFNYLVWVVCLFLWFSDLNQLCWEVMCFCLNHPCMKRTVLHFVFIKQSVQCSWLWILNYCGMLFVSDHRYTRHPASSITTRDERCVSLPLFFSGSYFCSPV